MEIDMEIFKNGPLSFLGSDTVQAPINWAYDKALAKSREKSAENYYKKLQLENQYLDSEKGSAEWTDYQMTPREMKESYYAQKAFTSTPNEDYASLRQYLLDLQGPQGKAGPKSYTKKRYETPEDWGYYEDPRAWQIGLEFLPTTYFNRAAVDLNKGRNEEAAWNAGTGAAYALAGPVAKLTKPAYGFATAALPEAAYHIKSLFQGPLSKGMLGKYYDQLGATQ